MSSIARASSLALLGLVATAAASSAQPSEPAALLAEIRAARLDPGAAVKVARTRLAAGVGTMALEDGILIPARTSGGRVVEMVFQGKGRITIEPPDAIEAGQLELFTGDSRLDEPFTEAVLVLGLDAAVDALMKKPRAGELPAAAAAAAEALFTTWRQAPQRQQLNVEAGTFIDAAGDPLAQGFFAAWFRSPVMGSETRGDARLSAPSPEGGFRNPTSSREGGEALDAVEDFLYLVEPGTREQVTVGRFVPLEASEREKRLLRRTMHRQQRQGRLIGMDLEDLGQWDTWLSAPLRDKAGKAQFGTAPFEPRKYILEVTLGDKGERLTGRARLDLAAIHPSRRVALRLARDLAVERVTDGAGGALFFLRNESDLDVLLPATPDAGDEVVVVVEYAGNLVERDGRTYALLDTIDWYPHAGTFDRAAYDVTFGWPKKLDLLAAGRRVDGGERPDGSRWERRTLDLPAAAYGFEVGHFDTRTVQAGHVKVTLAFAAASGELERKVRDEITEAVTGSLTYFEERFGPYPLDELTVVTTPRYFSQALLGFVTLSNLMMMDLDFFQALLGMEDRRTVVAHEIAHQWWAHMVGWASYRDQWLSEALANYSALLYARNALDWKDRYRIGPTSGWQSALTATQADGRTVDSLGPVVLGSRLVSSRSGDAYFPIVYYKGAVILDMLARSVGEDNFVTMLKETARVVAHGALSTEDLFAILERMSGGELDWFVDQYVYGTGLPEVYYTYRFEKRENGWGIVGTAQQYVPHRFRYRAAKTASGFDVLAEPLAQRQVALSSLVVPVELSLVDPQRPPAKGRKERANATGRSHVLLRGETTEFDLPIELEPVDFALDSHEEVYGRFFDGTKEPKRILFYQGLDAVAAGDAGRAADLFARALEAPLVGEDEEAGSGSRKEGRILDGRIHLGLARLHLDQGREAEAQAAFERADRTLEEGMGGWIEQEMKVLESRLEIRRGEYDRAFKRLRRGLKSGAVEGGEGQTLLAIAAKALGKTEEYERAAREARSQGADLAALTVAPGSDGS